MKIEISEKAYATISDQLAMLIQERKDAIRLAQRDGMPGFVRLFESTLVDLEEARAELKKAYRKK